MIRVRCPKCAWPFDVEDAMRGRSDRCPKCATPVPVPALSPGGTSVLPVIELRNMVMPRPLAVIDHDVQTEFSAYLHAVVVAVVTKNPFSANGPGADFHVSVTLKPGGKADFFVVTQP